MQPPVSELLKMQSKDPGPMSLGHWARGFPGHQAALPGDQSSNSPPFATAGWPYSRGLSQTWHEKKDHYGMSDLISPKASAYQALLIAREIWDKRESHLSSFVNCIYSPHVGFPVLYRNLHASDLPDKTVVDFHCM